jgi:hypothetical protein
VLALGLLKAEHVFLQSRDKSCAMKKTKISPDAALKTFFKRLKRLRGCKNFMRGTMVDRAAITIRLHRDRQTDDCPRSVWA